MPSTLFQKLCIGGIKFLSGAEKFRGQVILEPRGSYEESSNTAPIVVSDIPQGLYIAFSDSGFIDFAQDEFQGL